MVGTNIHLKKTQKVPFFRDPNFGPGVSRDLNLMMSLGVDGQALYEKEQQSAALQKSLVLAKVGLMIFL